MKRLLTVLIVGAVVIAIGTQAQSRPQDVTDPPAATPPAKSNLHPLMQMKLESSKQILEGLTVEDFDKIGKNARSLRLLSTESGWNVIQTEEYATQSRDFQRTCDLIAEAAKEKNISRATLGYVAMTVRCVECHAYMRKHNAERAKLSR